ncbi:MAG: bifunctional demethylmenaquinone methyltransferase/2-methoxy-6-polyprenyl-1,4-benzoquinol methylase UbiE [Bacteriovoracales bacterium]
MTISTRKNESYKIFDEIAYTYDFLNHFLSFGIDLYWRKKFLKNLPEIEKISVLDLATGTGDVPIVLAKEPRIVSVKGIDRSKKMVALGNFKITKKNLSKKVTLEMGDGVEIPFPDNTFDLVTISFGIRNFSDPQKSLNNILRVLKPGGRLLIMEFAIPKNLLIRKIYFLYFRNILPFIGNLLSRHGDAYSYLNETVEDFPHGEEFKKLVDAAGFANTSFQGFTFGIVNLYRGDKI